MSDYNLGTARGRIEVDTSGVSGNVKKAESDVGSFTSKLASSHRSITQVGIGVSAAGIAIGAGFALAVSSAMDYEHRMMAIKAVSGATTAEMDAVSKKALQLGKDTKFSAAEAATAIEELVKAGVSLPEVLNGAADSVVALAAAGEIALPEAATIAANAMNGFGITAKEMPKIADLIAGAANASAIDVHDFGESLKQVSAVAHLTGLSVKDTAVAIAEMGQAGIKGSDAGTSLKSFLMNLIPTSQTQIDLFKQLGFTAVGSGAAMQKLAALGIHPVSRGYDDVSKAMGKYIQDSGGAKVGTAKNNKAILALGTATGALKNQFFDAAGNAKSLSEMQQLLADKTKGMTKEQKLAAFNVMFGSDAIRAASILASNGAAGYEKMAGAMGKVTAAEVAATRQSSLSGKMENLRGSVETLAISIGTMLLPVMKSIVAWLTQVVNWFLGLSDETKKTILIIVGIIGVLSIVIGFIITVAGALGMLMTALAPVAALVGITAGVLLGWIAVIMLIVAAVVILGVIIWRNWDKIKAWTVSIWNSIKDWIVQTWNAIFAAVAGFLASIWATIVSVFSAIVGFFVSTWNSIYAAVAGFLASAWAIIVSVFTAIAGFFTTIWNGIWAFLVGVFNLIVAAITLAVTVWQTIISTVLTIIMAIWTGFWGLFGGIITAAFGLVQAIIALAMAMIMFIINTVGNAIVAVWTFLWGAVSTAVSAAWSFITGIISTALAFVASIVRAVITAVVGFLSAAWAMISTATSTAWAFIVAAVSGPLNVIRAVVTTVFGFVTGAISAAWNAVKTATSTAWTAVTTSISSAITNFMASISAIRAMAFAAISAAWDAIKSKTSEMWNSLTGIIGSAITNFMAKITGIKDRVIGLFSGAGSWLLDAGRNIIQGLVSGIESMIHAVTDKLKFLTDLIPKSKGPASRDKILLEDNGVLIMQSLINGIQSQVNPLQGMLKGITLEIPKTVSDNLPRSPYSSIQSFAQPAAGNSYSIGEITIPAKDLEEMRGVQDFFDRIQQESRRRVGASR